MTAIITTEIGIAIAAKQKFIFQLETQNHNARPKSNFEATMNFKKTENRWAGIWGKNLQHGQLDTVPLSSAERSAAYLPFFQFTIDREGGWERLKIKARQQLGDLR